MQGEEINLRPSSRYAIAVNENISENNERIDCLSIHESSTERSSNLSNSNFVTPNVVSTNVSYSTNNSEENDTEISSVYVSSVVKSNINLENMISEQSRLATFQGWPLTFIMPEQLAKSGFFYLKCDDKVQCAFCGGILGEWEEGDDPRKEHQKYYPTCPFIRGYFLHNGTLESLPNIPLINISDASNMDHHSSVQSWQFRRGIDVCGINEEIITQPSSSNSADADEASILLESLGIKTPCGPKHPEYALLDQRIKSFEGCPLKLAQKAQELAEAGFYFLGKLLFSHHVHVYNLGHSDHVACFHCNGGLHSWKEEDVPWIEHVKFYPKCDFVYLMRGKQFVQNCQEHLYAEKYDQMQQHGRKLSDVEIENLMTSENVLSALSYGIDRGKIKWALKKHLQQMGKIGTCQELMETALSFDDNDPEERNEGKNEEKLLIAPESAKELMPRQEGNLICKICMNNEVGVTFLPCGHLVSCVSCALVLKDCPICRKVICGVVRTFIS